MNDCDLAFSVGKANYTMTFEKIERKKRFLWKTWTDVSYNVSITITDTYDFDGYRDGKSLGAILNNWGYDRQQSNQITPFKWKISFVKKGLK